MDHTVEFIHRLVGYPLAFLVAPLALATFASTRVADRLKHRGLGRWYLYLMTFLYISGTFLTLTRHPWASWDFARNLTFNFLGFSTILFGARAMVLFQRLGEAAPGTLDRVLAGLLLATASALALLALAPDPTVRVFAVIAAVLAALEIRELRAGFQPRELLYRRHIRYVLVSYFYVLTVASIVHLGDELPRDLKWLWPSAVGALVVCAATATAPAWLRRHRARVTRAAVLTTLTVGLCFGGYALYEVLRDL